MVKGRIVSTTIRPAAQHLTFAPATDNVRIIATISKQIVVPLRGLTQAQWTRSVALEAIDARFVPIDPKGATDGQRRKKRGYGTPVVKTRAHYVTVRVPARIAERYLFSGRRMVEALEGAARALPAKVEAQRG